ncbi:TetR/AcrR family transcriptional regulator [Martelella alba]|uniref:TetR/AcrR family transcriptional regulator n=1 Tax=Martelella alba TaxID=2590451 RepID=A0ABY2SRL5_9HYPH|nr:TetR/AcrR family transcriptional regulator [Martelella alba]TKI06721.1 TetR/AcrR family transcriptional regulator [Martelella alba]
MSISRPGGRSAAVKKRAFEAARTLALQHGLHHVTLPEIARVSGIAPTSLYRRWGDVGALLMEMAVDRLNDTSPLPDEGSIALDLGHWARRIVVGLNADAAVNFFHVLLATTGMASGKRKDALAPRLAQLQILLERAEARGEAVPEVADVIDHLLAPLYMRSVLGMPLSESDAERLVGRLLKT